MNMASIGILLFIFTAICIIPGNAQNAFIDVQCKTENVGQYGQQSLLECVIQTGQNIANAKILVVSWKKKRPEIPLLVFNKGRYVKQQPGYLFAEPSWEETNMNVSLLITNTAVKDKGEYTCMVMTDSGDDISSTSLKVTAKYSKPTIRSIPETITPNTDHALMCNSDGGYPEGRIRWFDKDNMEWTKSSVMEVKQTESGLFRLSSNLTLLRGSTYSKYTCKVFNASGGKEDEATFNVQGITQPEGQEQGKGLDPASKIIAPVVVIGSLIVGLLMVLLFYRRRSQQARRHSATPLMSDHQGVRTCESDVDEGDDQEMDKKCQDTLA